MNRFFLLWTFLGMTLIAQGQGNGLIRFHAVHLNPYPKMTILVTIEDGRGKALPILPERLRLFEDDLQIKNFSVSSEGETLYPLSTVLVMDCSGSMKGEPMNKARLGAKAYVNSMRSGDRVGLVSFTDRPNLEAGMVDDGAAVIQRIDALPCSGNTALYDALGVALDQLKNESERQVKVMLVLTDGLDNRSTLSQDRITNRLRSEGAMFYLMALGKGAEDASMDALAEAAKGRCYRVKSPDDLADRYLEIAKLLQARLEIGHQVTHPADGKWHAVRMEVDTPFGMIQGQRPYLADTEMRVNTTLLHQIQEHGTASNGLLSGDIPGLVVMLVLLLAGLTLALIILMIKKRNR